MHLRAHTSRIALWKSDKYGIHKTANVWPSKSCEMLLLEGALDPLDLASLYPLCDGEVNGGVCGGDEDWLCSHLDRFGAAGAGERIRADNQVNMVGGVNGREQWGDHDCWRCTAVLRCGGVAIQVEGPNLTEDEANCSRRSRRSARHGRDRETGSASV